MRENKILTRLTKIFYTSIICIIFSSCDNSTNEKHSFENYEPIILISIDGFRWDYFEKTETPNFDKIIDGAVISEGLVPVFPSKTFPSHLSIVTGNYPTNHGIISNRMYDQEFNETYYIGQGSKAVVDPKWYESEPIWVTAEKQNKVAMTMFWPGSDAKIMGVNPSEYHVYDGSVSHDNRIDQIINWIKMDIDKRPDIITLYFSYVDSQGHKHGPESDEIKEAIQEMDRVVGNLTSRLSEIGVLENCNIIMTSDHGMAQLSPDKVIFIDDYIDLEKVYVVDWSPVIAIIPDDVNETYDQLFDQHPNLKIYRKDDIPSRLHYNEHKRITPIIGIADEGWSITTRDRFNEENYLGGNHGYDPKYQSMHGIFIAKGPSFQSNKNIPPLHSIHLYEMMCHILNIEPATNDGSLDSTKAFLSR